MHASRLCRLVIITGILACSSCGGHPKGPKIKRVPVVPVQGSITVNGKAEAGIIIRCIPRGAFEPKELENALGGRTDESGDFTLGTYEIADGVPPAEYVLTFTWPEISMRKQSRADEVKSDRLKGKYAKPDTAAVKLKVESDPVVLDPIELKTK